MVETTLLSTSGWLVLLYMPVALTVKALEVDMQRSAYLTLENSLWQYTTRHDKMLQLEQVLQHHREFINTNSLLQTDYQPDKYGILNLYEWKLLEGDLLNLNQLFAYFRSFLNKEDNNVDVNAQELLDLCEEVLRNGRTFSIPRTFRRIETITVNQTLYRRVAMASKDYMCQTQQSPQQFVHSLYSDIALTELKGYTMMEFSWMILRLYNKGNYTKEAELMRENYDRRNKRTLKELHTVMQRADRSIWRCDPDKYVLGETYDEVTRLLQGYIENEVDMNNEETCRETCEYYTVTHSQGCFKGGTKFCSRQPRCSGKLYNCQYIDSDMLVCPEDNNSTRRYRYIQYENGEFYGEEKTCQKNIIPVDSWWRYLFWHCSYCMCLCDEQGPKSDRYFSLRPTVSDTDRNMIVTGVRMVKKKRVFHIQIQQAELLPRGIVNVSTISWKPLETFNIFDDNVRSGRDYHTLKYENRSIDLDDVEMVDSDFVVTGVVFKMIGTHLNLAVRFSEAHFETGKLVSPHVNSIWMSNDTTPISGNRSKIKLSEPTVPTRTIIKSSMRSHSNQYIDFTNTNLQGDVAQTTVPFIDSQDVVSKSPVPLSGVGIYYKGQNGYGGFIAPKIITYDLTPFTRVVKSVKFNKL